MRKIVFLIGLVAAVAAPAAAASPGPKLASADRRAVSTLLDRFVVEAIARRDPGAAYDLASAELREGMTRKEWATGDIPVYPYDPRGSHFPWTLQSLAGKRARIELLLQPRSKKQGALTLVLDIVKTKRRWLVAQIQPVAAFAPEDAPARISAQRDFQPSAASAGADSSRLSPLWFGLPIGVLVVGLISIPLFLIVRNRRRVRRIEAEFGRPAALPPLPRRQA
jgi:hypothetical protein